MLTRHPERERPVRHDVGPFKGTSMERYLHYRNRAKEIRTLAKEFIHECLRDAILDVASRFDRLASEVRLDEGA